MVYVYIKSTEKNTNIV